MHHEVQTVLCNMPAIPNKVDEAENGPNRLDTMHQSFHHVKEDISFFFFSGDESKEPYFIQ